MDAWSGLALRATTSTIQHQRDSVHVPYLSHGTNRNGEMSTGRHAWDKYNRSHLQVYSTGDVQSTEEAEEEFKSHRIAIKLSKETTPQKSLLRLVRPQSPVKTDIGQQCSSQRVKNLFFSIC